MKKTWLRTEEKRDSTYGRQKIQQTGMKPLFGGRPKNIDETTLMLFYADLVAA